MALKHYETVQCVACSRFFKIEKLDNVRITGDAVTIDYENHQRIGSCPNCGCDITQKDVC